MSAVWSKRHEEWAVKNISQRSNRYYMDKYGRGLDYDLSFLSLRDHLDCLNAWATPFQEFTSPAYAWIFPQSLRIVFGLISTDTLPSSSRSGVRFVLDGWSVRW